MGPPLFLEYNLEGIRIFLSHGFEDSLIFDEIECTGRVDHLPSDFERYQGGFKKFLLEVCDFFHTLQMPVCEDIASSEGSPLTTTGGVEKYTIEDFGLSCEILPWIEGHGDTQTSHTIEVLEELGDAFTRRFICDDKTLRKIFCELGRLAPWTRCHIQYEKWFIMDRTIREDIDGMSSCEFLNIEIPHEVVECITESSFKGIEFGDPIDLEA